MDMRSMQDPIAASMSPKKGKKKGENIQNTNQKRMKKYKTQTKKVLKKSRYWPKKYEKIQNTNQKLVETDHRLVPTT